MIRWNFKIAMMTTIISFLFNTAVFAKEPIDRDAMAKIGEAKRAELIALAFELEEAITKGMKQESKAEWIWAKELIHTLKMGRSDSLKDNRLKANVATYALTWLIFKHDKRADGETLAKKIFDKKTNEKDRKNAALLELLYTIEELPNLVGKIEAMAKSDRDGIGKNVAYFLPPLKNIATNFRWLDNNWGILMTEPEAEFNSNYEGTLKYFAKDYGIKIETLKNNLKNNTFVGKLRAKVDKSEKDITSEGKNRVIDDFLKDIPKKKDNYKIIIKLLSLASADSSDKHAFLNQVLTYMKNEKPLTKRYKDRFGKYGNILAKLIEEYPSYIEFGEKENKFDSNGYKVFAIKTLREAKTFGDLNFYAAIGASLLKINRDDDMCSNAGHYCEDANVSTYHEKIGFQYKITENIPTVFQSPLYFNVYAGGLLFQITPVNADHNTDLESRYLLGAEFSIYPEKVIEVSIGAMHLHHKNAKSIDKIYFGLSVPLEEYFTALTD